MHPKVLVDPSIVDCWPCNRPPTPAWRWSGRCIWPGHRRNAARPVRSGRAALESLHRPRSGW